MIGGEQLRLEQLLAVPYVLSCAAIEAPDGDWVCHLSYDELPGCEVTDPDPYAALDRIDALRVEIITEMIATDREVPLPRFPLSS